MAVTRRTQSASYLAARALVEPANPRGILFTRGEPCSPFSIGRRGAWQVTAAGVEDVHAFAYFDATRLWLLSLSHAQPVRLLGAALNSVWTEVPVPAMVELGECQLLVEECDFDSRLLPPPVSIAGSDLVSSTSAASGVSRIVEPLTLVQGCPALAGSDPFLAPKAAPRADLQGDDANLPSATQSRRPDTVLPAKAWARKRFVAPLIALLLITLAVLAARR